MRPDRAIVKKAIVDAGGDKSKAAILLGCSRQTLYTWLYQLGLERLAGVRLDTRHGLDTAARQDTRSDFSEKKLKHLSNQAPSGPSILRVVEATQAQDYPIQASMRLPESLWKRVKIRAIEEGCTVGDYVRKVLEASLPEQAEPKRRSLKRGTE